MAARSGGQSRSAFAEGTPTEGANYARCGEMRRRQREVALLTRVAECSACGPQLAHLLAVWPTSSESCIGGGSHTHEPCALLALAPAPSLVPSR